MILCFIISWRWIDHNLTWWFYRREGLNSHVGHRIKTCDVLMMRSVGYGIKLKDNTIMSSNGTNETKLFYWILTLTTVKQYYFVTKLAV